MPTRTPDRVSSVLNAIIKDPAMNGAVTAMMDRATEFRSPLAAKLTGVALNPLATQVFGEKLDKMWAEGAVPREVPEIVIGGGLHAAVYCSVRVSQGFPKPLVIERNERVGGTFAVSKNASFFLNSRNRPGKLGSPGRAEALNYLAAAPVQPADLSGEEYQPNSALAFAIRAALAMNARVVVGQTVTAADSRGVTLEGGKRIKATRVIYATGLGEEKKPAEADGKRLMTYLQFLAHLDSPFPFRDIRRVAVVGAKDAGRTAIEALCGQGPASPWSVASLDYIDDKIDWYGVEETCLSKPGWERNNRSRYKGIGRLLPLDVNAEGTPLSDSRVKPITRRAGQIGLGFDGAYIDGARYDLVIWAAGFTPPDVSGLIEYKAGGRVVARMEESGVFYVGPVAQISDAREQNVPGTVPENSAAAFRYTDRTASLAMHLPEWDLPGGGGGEKKTKPKPKAKRRTKRVGSDFVEFNRFGDVIEPPRYR